MHQTAETKDNCTTEEGVINSLGSELYDMLLTLPWQWQQFGHNMISATEANLFFNEHIIFFVLLLSQKVIQLSFKAELWTDKKQIYNTFLMFHFSSPRRSPSRSRLCYHLVMHTNLCCNSEQWPAAACLSHQTCIRNRCNFDVGLFMLPHVHESANECVRVCLCVFVSVLQGPAGASRAWEMRLHVPTHRERGEADRDIWQDK